MGPENRKGFNGLVEIIVEDIHEMLEQIREDRQTAAVAALSLLTGFILGIRFVAGAHF